VRRVLAALALVILLCLDAANGSGALVTAVGAIGVTVTSAERSAAFYTRVLNFEQVSDTQVTGGEYERLQGVPGLRLRVIRVRLGDEALDLMEYVSPRGRPVPRDSRSNDHSFQHVAIIVSDMDAAYARLRDHHVAPVSPAPQRLPDWNPAAGGIRAFYFKDSDGHPLEVLAFPADKGDPRWRRHAGRLFLGIDHTAIVVGDTERSLACYRDTLGLAVAGTSENWGPEQERLNNVSGARLRITTLRAAAGPGIELLEYLTPRDGRPIPPGTRANDVAHWQTALITEDARALTRAVRDHACSMRSPTLVVLPRRELGFARASLARDPDGHVLQLTER